MLKMNVKYVKNEIRIKCELGRFVWKNISV